MIHTWKTAALALLCGAASTTLAVPRLWNNPANLDDSGTDITVDNLGVSHAVGTTDSGGKSGKDLVVCQRDILGGLTWSYVYRTGWGWTETGDAIDRVGSGDVYVVGTRRGPFVGKGGLFSAPAETIVLRFSASGTLLNQSVFTGLGGDTAPTDVAVFGGSVYVSGSSRAAGSKRDGYLLRLPLDLSTQAVRYVAGTAGLDDVVTELTVDTTGNVFYVGTVSNTGSGDDVVAGSVDPTLALRWQAVFNGAGNATDTGTGIALDTLNHVYVSGQTDGGVATRDDGLVLLFDKNGVGPGVYTHNRVADHFDSFADIATDGAGNAVACGTSRASTNDYAVVKVNAGLVPVWTTYYDGTAGLGDSASSVAVSGTATFVTGRSSGTGAVGSPVDCTTISFTAAGAVNWVNRFDQAGHLDAGVKCVLAANDLWVVGGSESPALQTDLLMDRIHRVTGSSIW
ncbi:MAG: hypothetical protein JST30_05325 [Armatimonadetes bacterium]|nr:hypothetical protein [Armatimonadota bacterium]